MFKWRMVSYVQDMLGYAKCMIAGCGIPDHEPLENVVKIKIKPPSAARDCRYHVRLAAIAMRQWQ
jgi:hypothetical protein